jgi:rhodanese-related sulfurtransferase
MNTILYISSWNEKVRGIQIQLLFYNATIQFSSTNGNFVKFILDHIFVVAIAVISGGALLWPALAPRGRRATPLQATQMMNRGKATAVIDVRGSDEFAAGHLRDAKHIPLADLGNRIGELDKSKTKTVIVVCQSGARADKAARQFRAAGFEDVYTLDGGVAAWTAAGLPLTK